MNIINNKTLLCVALLATVPTLSLPKVEQTWLIFNRLEEAFNHPHDYHSLTRSASTAISTTTSDPIDPLMNFWNDIFAIIAKIIKPKTCELTLPERQIFVEQLEKAKGQKSGFFTGFNICFLRRVAFVAICSRQTDLQIQTLQRHLKEFLLAHGFSSPIMPQQLINSDTPQFSTPECQLLTQQLFEEFDAIHHYCLAWQMAEQHSEEELARITAKNQRTAYLQQLDQELETLKLELEKQQNALAQEQMLAKRAQEQQNRRLIELATAQHELELEYNRQQMLHAKNLQALELEKAQSEHQLEMQEHRQQVDHLGKIKALERQKLDLEVKFQTLGLFERTVQRFAECLSTISQLKKQPPHER